MACTARQAVRVNPVVPTAPCAPAAPGHIVFFLAEGVAGVMRAPIALDVGGDWSSSVLSKGRHRECGGGGNDADKREFQHDGLLLVVSDRRTVRRKRGTVFPSRQCRATMRGVALIMR